MKAVLYTNETQFRRTCAIRAANFLPCIQPANRTFDVRTIIKELHKIEIEQNRWALKSIIDTVQVCAIQKIALRGHHYNDGPVDPPGNPPI